MNERAAVTMVVALLALAAFAGSDASTAEGRPVKPCFESEKGWSFDAGERLVFFNPSPNPDGTRFLRWEGYTWVVTGEKVACVDPRPFGTTVQGTRFQVDGKGREVTDKDLMKDLKKQARNIRDEKDPNEKSLPVSVNTGLSFQF
jgi:hypothetical protein